jgi:6-phosphogluconolactonase/glucosamine-6-phosphate isomerase/deaminase
MKRVVCDETESLASASFAWVEDSIARYHARSIFVPAGATPTDLYARWSKDKPTSLDGIRLLQIDDVATGKRSGMFREFLLEHLPHHAHQLVEIGDADGFADLAILGLGLNGHVAFHEPGLPASFYSGCVRLGATTCESLDLEPGAWGITYGVAAFMRAKAILMIVKGSAKCDVLERLMKSDPALPAAALIAHPDFTILCDRAAAGS